MSITIIVPSRYGSTRFPGKPLHVINGKPLIRHTVDAIEDALVALNHPLDIKVYVATDHQGIADAVGPFAQVVMTPADGMFKAVNGTERCAQAAYRLGLKHDDWVINWQGDAPLTPHRALTSVVERMREFGWADRTVITPLYPVPKWDESAVTGALGKNGRVRYFSRAKLRTDIADVDAFAHVGMYAYRVRELLEYATTDESMLERAESLEQLRFIDNDVPVYAALIGKPNSPIVELNTPADAEILKELLP